MMTSVSEAFFPMSEFTRRQLFCAVVAVLFSPCAFSAETTQITWPDAIRLARENNAELKAFEAQLRSKNLQEGNARAGFLPVLTGTLAGSREAPSAGDLGSAATNYEASLGLTQNLFTGWADRARVRQAKANSAASEAKLATMKARLSFELKSNVQGLLFAKSNIELSQSIVTRREQNLKMVQLRFEGGRENKGSVLLSEAYLQDARLQLLQARNGYDVAHATLKQTLGIDDDARIELTGEIPLREPSAKEIAKEIDFRSLALLTPTYSQALAEEQAAQEEIAVKRSGFFPSLNLTGGAGRTGDTFLPQTQKWTVGLSLSMPLFNGGRDDYSTKSASEDYLSAARLRENSGRVVIYTLETAYSEYLEAEARLKTNLAFREALRVRAKIAKAKYGQGLLSFDDWDVIENDLVDRERNYLTSSRERVAKEAAWEQRLGRGVIP